MFSYIHIPFCESKCKYCRFASLWSVNKALVKTYISHLLKDIHDFKRPEWNTSGLLRSIYFWWGTPSILEETDLEYILKTMRKKFWFEKNIEITLETTPKNITKENLISWENLWINRVSMWIQTLNNQTLKTIQRDKKEVILAWLNHIQNSKIQNISVDFIIWLPYVKKWETLQDIRYILETYPFIKHISVYMLEDYYTESEDDSNFEKITYPKDWVDLWLKEEDFLWEYWEIKKYLENKWFQRYELSNFAQPWYECKHNQSYWTHEENVWFWLWSHSFLGGRRYAYKDDFLWYYRKELEYDEVLCENDIFLEKVMFGLRTNGLTKDIYKKLNQEKIADYIEKWWLKIQNNFLKITDSGIPLSDAITSEIL